MPSIEKSDFRNLYAKIAEVEQAIPTVRRELHERLGEIAKRTVDAKIDASLNDQHDKVKNWQRVFIGSKGGYSAVRATSEAVDGLDASGKNSAGAITNYLESGHSYKNDTGYVSGRHFYRQAENELDSKVNAEAEAYINNLLKKLGE